MLRTFTINNLGYKKYETVNLRNIRRKLLQAS